MCLLLGELLVSDAFANQDNCVFRKDCNLSFNRAHGCFRAKSASGERTKGFTLRSP